VAFAEGDPMTQPTNQAASACRSFLSWNLVGALTLASVPPATADDAADGNAYLAFIRDRAAAMRATNAPPRSLAEWTERRLDIRRSLARALGPVPDPPAPLDPTIHGTLDRDGYRVEKVTFQTLPGVRMTANLYLPKSPDRHPAILAVHGHWHGAKQDPVVQSRCIGAAKLGFAVLVVDAFGAGERAVGKALGEYHGEMTAATLFPTGQTLAGIQVYENARALAYLATRPEVDATRVGVTGASGGGNQTMYAIAMIDDLKAAVPVCSVGNYRSYLGTACCMCELVPGGLTFAEEWGVLGLAAPKPLMIVNATKDAVQFSVAEAKKTIAGLEVLYGLSGSSQNLRHAVFESGHDYSKPMREAAYGWFSRHLAGQGDGSPIAEPAIKTEDPDSLRCFPGKTRPDDFMTLPKYAAAEGRRLSDAKSVPIDSASWKAESERRRAALVTALGGFPNLPRVSPRAETEGHARIIRFEPEPGLRLAAWVEPGKEADAPRVVLLDLGKGEAASTSPIAGELRKSGWTLVTLDLRATGRLAVPSDKIGDAPDHDSAQWGLWIGRPLLGQWVYDVRRLLDALDAAGGSRPRETVLVGVGPAGLVALAAAATDPRISSVAAVGTLASYISEEPYRSQRLGTIVPGLLRDVGDVSHLAALVAPRRVVIAGGVSGGGHGLSADRLRKAYEPAARAFGLLGSGDAIRLLDTTDAADVVKALR
jgi:dienelactone hydrolase